MEPKTYSQAGVNIAKAEAFVDRLKKISRRPAHDKLWPAAGGYASVYPLDASHGVALTTDGVGTKLLVALEQNKLDTIGIDLVAMCANDLLCAGARPVAFLDYYAIGKLEDADADQLIAGIVSGCDQAGMILIGGETAEMPDLYQERHFDVAGFAVGLVSRVRLLTGELLRPGQTLVGIASSGIHSNGLSLARKIIQPGDASRAQLLVPTLIYCQPINYLLDRNPDLIQGLAHITGGGWRNLLRLNSRLGFHIDNPLPVPGIFKQIAEQVESREMYETFNMGMGFAVITADDGETIVKVCAEHGFQAQVIGRVTDAANQIIVEGGLNSKSPILLEGK
ncbi:MAG TPA: phosphoribosylformylglycinamidine cyclo-ligase [Candidatus Obscuribacterales bacterium]